MPATSEARIQANRRNAQHSSGPRTAEGKEQSRRNSLKHGLTGAGVVIAEQDTSEVDRRAASLLAELAPKSTIGLAMIGQLAMLSVRMERGAKQEAAALATRVRHAAEDFDHDRLDHAEALFESIADDPRSVVRKLRRSPEGVDRLLEAWDDLRDLLTASERPVWTASDQDRVANLLGLAPERARGKRVDLLSMALQGEPVELSDPEWRAMDPSSRLEWARARLVERVVEEIAGLEEHLETLDREMIALDRLGAADVALFDSSRGATLARRYESEARRGFFKCLNELRQAEAEFAAASTAVVARPAPRPAREPELPPVAEPLGSSRSGTLPTSRAPELVARPTAYSSRMPIDGAARGLDGRVISVGQAGGVSR